MLEELCDTYYEAINWAIFEIRVFQRASGISPSGWRRAPPSQRAGCNAYLERALDGRACFNGDTFGWGDLAVIPFVHAAALTGAPPAAGSRLGDLARRASCSARASPAPSRRRPQSMTGLRDAAAAGRIGSVPREYRDHRLEWMLRSGGVDIVLDGMRKGNIRFSRELE